MVKRGVIQTLIILGILALMIFLIPNLSYEIRTLLVGISFGVLLGILLTKLSEILATK